MKKKILLGKITTAFGVKGDVKLESYCNPAHQIETYDLFDKNDQKISLKISNKNKTVIGHTNSGGSILIARIAGIEDRNEAEKLRGLELFANREDFKKTKKNEFYIDDLIGLDVIDEENKKIGKLITIHDFGGGAMLEIKFLDEEIKKKHNDIENFPFKNEFFSDVNLEKNFIVMKDYNKK